MTSVKFLADSKGIYGFEISGHCSVNGDDEVGKIVCAAVSSAAYLTANTLTEILGANPEIFIDEAKMCLSIKNPSEEERNLLKGLKLHLKELSDQYSNNIRIFGGVNHVKD